MHFGRVSKPDRNGTNRKTKRGNQSPPHLFLPCVPFVLCYQYENGHTLK